MGMYTELVMGVELTPDKDVIQKLEHMLDDTKPDIKIDHPLFSDDTRWKYMLISSSYYFDRQADSQLYYDDTIYEKYFLNVGCNLKNYDNEISLFLDWLCPYIVTEGFLGYTRYEEAECPTLIYKEDGKIVYQRVSKGE